MATKKARYHEHAGMERKMHGYHKGDAHHMHSDYEHVSEGHYEGMKSRRHEEMRDAGMITEDHNEIANLPQNVMIKPYPRTGPYMPEPLDDTIHGIDKQMDYDDGKRRQHFHPKKV